jgi:integrase
MSDKTISNLALPKSKQIDWYDDPTGNGAVKGLLLKASPGGAKTFYLLYRPKNVKGSRQHRLGPYPALKLAAARTTARVLISALAADRDHLEKQKEDERKKQAVLNVTTFSAVADTFKKIYIDGNKLRTGDVMWAQIKKHLLPKLGAKDFNAISLKRDLTPLFDGIANKHGAAMSDSVLTIFKTMVSFQLGRDEDFRSPIPNRMKRRYKSRRRKRVLSDAEIMAFWNATAKMGTFGSLARISLLTGARRAKVNFMKWADIKNGIWTLGLEDREKPNCGWIFLPTLALSIIQAQPKLDKNPFVFTGSRKPRRAFTAFANSQKELMKLMREEIPDMPAFTLHDLRRTFRTRCSMIGVERETAERCIGHVIGNQIERTYDLWDYPAELTEAFAAVAAHIDNIINPPPSDNVVRMDRRAQ